ncbi:putative brevis radix (BRX) domain, transcription factor BREVIS RADIX domain-containing protein [Helianthus annuus]|nr:putative brevis radix (BRX) domain, transcription factor BREVIS RADIX domain-containing protein [Helianthus annuus]
MLTCIACSKQLNGGEDDGDTATTPGTKQSVKSLTSQIKDIALKASGAYKNCKPCTGSSGNNNPTRRGYPDSETGSMSGRFFGGYHRTGSSTPRVWGKEMEARLKGLSSGASTPASVSGRTDAAVVFMEEDESKEWVAQVEPGVLITFVSLPRGGNDLKRIRFSREMFNKWQAQRWWSENCEKITELYNVQQFNQQGVPLPSPPRSEPESLITESTEASPVTPQLSKEHPPRNFYNPTGIGYSSSDSLDQQPNLTSGPKCSNISGPKTEASSLEASRRTSSSQGADQSEELSLSNASDLENECIEQDEPGVYITIRTLPGGVRELRRVRFSRERFGEMHARMWWEQNRARIQQQYL